jgi:LysM repeat protein
MTFLALVLAAFGTTPPPPAPVSHLPATLPGLGRDEGVFLVTAADDGSRVAYFVAQNTRHAILEPDLQVEQQLNPLWPVRVVSRDEALVYAEAEPIGAARAGLLAAPVAEVVEVAEAASADVDPAAVAEDMPSEAVVYVLKPGDNLTYISRDHGTTVQAILEANGLNNANRIYAGQSLVIPGTAAPAPIAEVVEDVPVAADEAPSPTYTVKRGDSAIGIARQLDIDVNDLLTANGIADRNRIYAGQILTIPGQSS